MAKFSRFFVDTSYVLGVYNKSDQFHDLCVSAIPLAQKARELFITHAVLMEIGNAFSAIKRRTQGAKIIRNFLRSPKIKVISLTPEYFDEALELYEGRVDI